jgi:hypothetical protein
MFMDGMTFSAIAKRLTEDGVPTPGGKTVWQAATVRSILTKNSSYLRKRFYPFPLKRDMSDKLPVNADFLPPFAA